MCGIAGVIDFKGDSDQRELVGRMIGYLHHRGPDAAGLYGNGPAVLGHSRLSIIDLAGGDQPIHNEDRGLWIVFNGEIFNYPELRKELVDSGHRFYSLSDTEVLIHAYEEYGPQMLKHLIGQFAFAVWDQKNRTLFMARDRVGIRPMFYHRRGRRLVFASEIKALFADRCIGRSLDPETLGDVFTCWAPLGDRTAFEGVWQIPPGCYGFFSDKGLEIQRYWQVDFVDSDPWQRPLGEWIEELRELLLDATRIRLRADVPVGAYLSGGLDSTFTTAMVKKHFNNALRTFSVTFSDKRYDETEYQAKAVSALHTDHSDIVCTETDIGDAFPKVVWHTETPILRTAPAPLYQLSKLVHDSHFKVVLTGEGADEVFAGYNIFKEDRLRRFWARRPDSNLRPRLLEKLYPYIFAQGDGKAKAYLKSFFRKSLADVDSPVFSHRVRWKNADQLKGFFAPGVISASALEDFERRYIQTLPKAFSSWQSLSKAQFTEMSIFLSNYLLSSQGDRMAMAHAVEGRYPFLDHRVVEFAARLPVRLRLNGLTEKYILKQAARGYVPDELVDRPKQPYRAPISRCFFGDGAPEYVEAMLGEAAIREAGLFDPTKVGRLVEKCRRSRGEVLSERENMAVVGILSTQLLHEQFVRRFPAEPLVRHARVAVMG